jgi:glutathione synthase/RimK-type ligase-like ATP-grasp enzyme
MKALQRAGIAVPKWTVLTPDTRLDEKEWGPVVILKPAAWRFASGGKGISLMRTEKVRFRERTSFPEGHPGRHDSMIVQQFIPTGEYPTKTRVLSLFGEILYGLERVASDRLPEPGASDEVIEAGRVVSSGGALRTSFVINKDLIDLARRVFKCFPLVPLQGVDIIYDSRDGAAYVLEINPGGNTWHFSSRWAAAFEKELGSQKLKDQLGAFDIAASVLIERTRLEAR